MDPSVEVIPGEDEVGTADLFHGLGDDQRGGKGVRTADRIILNMHGGVRTHLQCLAHRECGGFRPDGERHHLPALALDERQGLLDRILVQFGEDTVHRFPLRRGVGGEMPISLGIRTVLDTGDDLHERTLLWAMTTRSDYVEVQIASQGESITSKDQDRYGPIRSSYRLRAPAPESSSRGGARGAKEGRDIVTTTRSADP